MHSQVQSSLLNKNRQRQRRILCIDDDAINCMVIDRMLMPLEFQVDLASSGSAGLELARQYQYDLVLLDIFMPEMNGFQTAAKLRELSAEVIPIIFLSAGIHEELQEQMTQLNIDLFLPKPINKQDLIKLMNDLL